MITKENLHNFLICVGFTKEVPSGEMFTNIFVKHFPQHDTFLKVDLEKLILIYPEGENGIKINERQTCNFNSNENFVVFECVNRLLAKGYKPEHIELEPKWKVGHGASGGRADILVSDHNKKPLLII